MNKKYQESSAKAYWIIGGITVAVFAFIVFASLGFSILPKPTKPSAEAAFDCVNHSNYLSMHIHPRLAIVVNGETAEIPADINISSSCMGALHTHDTSGVIHVEYPREMDFHLGDFFLVWGQTFNSSQVLEHKTDENHTIRMTVNGQDSQEFENLILRDHDEIVIYYENIDTETENESPE